jgi:hypothetical protein
MWEPTGRRRAAAQPRSRSRRPAGACGLRAALDVRASAALKRRGGGGARRYFASRRTRICTVTRSCGMARCCSRRGIAPRARKRRSGRCRALGGPRSRRGGAVGGPFWQDRASCLPAHALAGLGTAEGPTRYPVVLDACAAPGNKAAHALAVATAPDGLVLAVERCSPRQPACQVRHTLSHEAACARERASLPAAMCGASEPFEGGCRDPRRTALLRKTLQRLGASRVKVAHPSVLCLYARDSTPGAGVHLLAGSETAKRRLPKAPRWLRSRRCGPHPPGRSLCQAHRLCGQI